VIDISSTHLAAAKPKAIRRVDLVEWENKDIALLATEAADIVRCPSQVLHVQMLPAGICRLRPESIIGRLRIGSVDLRILPKYPMPSLLAMLVEVHELAHLTPDLVGYDTSPEIVDLLVQIFLSQVDRVVRQGLKRTYIHLDEELVPVRGRIDLGRTVGLHLRGKARVQCQFEEHALDGPENRLLVAALHAIAGSQALHVRRRNLAQGIAGEFVGVQSIPLGQCVREQVKYDRLNQHYYPTLQLAHLILKATGITQDYGFATGDGFLLDMNQLFEKYVYRRLAKTLGSNQVSVDGQKTFPFDVAKQAKIKPDVIIRNRFGRLIVGDTKYKVGTTPDPGDLYQMLSYCRVLKVPYGFLVTVGTGEIKRYDVLDGDTTIDVIPVDLGGSVLNIDKSIHQLADRLLGAL
jgi:5-methylcytosine-specific restriction enzyme subunit McrC